MKIEKRILGVIAFGLVACGGTAPKPSQSGGLTALAAALMAGVHFEDGQLEKETLPTADSSTGRVKLSRDASALVIAPAGASIMALDVDNPDQDINAVAATLIQFADGDGYIKVPAATKTKTTDAGAGQGDLFHIENPFKVDDDLCKGLCDRVYETQIEFAVLLRDGKVSRHEMRDLEVDCSKRGDPAKCIAPDAKKPGTGGADAAGGRAGASSQEEAGVSSGSGGIGGAGNGRSGGNGGSGGMDAGTAGVAGGTENGGTGGGAGGAAGQTMASESDAGAEDGSVGAPACDAGTGSSRIMLQFDTNDADRVTSVVWIDSSSTMTGNLVAENSGSGCGGPTEFFGQAYGSPEFTTFAAGFSAGHRASLVQCGLDTTVTAAPTADCGNASQLPMTTAYRLFSDARASEVRISRTFGMDTNTPVGTGTGLRPYVPRLHADTFTTVIYPNQAGTAVASVSDAPCSTDCITSIGASWNGRWFADIAPSNGYAMIVLREPSMTSPVNLAVNNDAGSGSNLSSFVLIQPTGGWKAPVTEVEYLCFEDLNSWPQAQRDAAQLPAGCGP
jgi:hypothetical protein